MPPLSFEEPKGGPFAKTARVRRPGRHHRVEEPAEQAEQLEQPEQVEQPVEAPEVEHPTEILSELFVTDEEEPGEEEPAPAPKKERREPAFLLRGLVEPGSGAGSGRRNPSRDTVLVILKAATVAVGLALVGLVILLTTSGGDEPEAKAPAVPNIATSHDPSAGRTTTTTDVGAIIAPPVHSETTQIAPSLPPSPPQPSVPVGGPPVGNQNQFVNVGDKCDTPGAYAFTQRYQPVVCDQGRGNNRLTWRPIFR